MNFLKCVIFSLSIVISNTFATPIIKGNLPVWVPYGDTEIFHAYGPMRVIFNTNNQPLVYGVEQYLGALHGAVYTLKEGTWVPFATPDHFDDLMAGDALSMTSTNNSLYAVYDDESLGVLAAHFDGKQWVPLPEVDKNGQVGAKALAVDHQGQPYVVLTHFSENRNAITAGIYVKTLVHNQWVTLGDSVANPLDATPFWIGVDSHHIVYVAYGELINVRSEFYLKKYVNGQWQNVGTEPAVVYQEQGDPNDYPSVALNAEGVPYIAYTNVFDPVTAIKTIYLDQNKWVPLPDIFTRDILQPSIMINNHQVSVAYRDDSTEADFTSAVHVMTLQDQQWHPIAMPKQLTYYPSAFSLTDNLGGKLILVIDHSVYRLSTDE